MDTATLGTWIIGTMAFSIFTIILSSFMLEMYGVHKVNALKSGIGPDIYLELPLQVKIGPASISNTLLFCDTLHLNSVRKARARTKQLVDAFLTYLQLPLSELDRLSIHRVNVTYIKIPNKWTKFFQPKTFLVEICYTLEEEPTIIVEDTIEKEERVVLPAVEDGFKYLCKEEFSIQTNAPREIVLFREKR